MKTKSFMKKMLASVFSLFLATIFLAGFVSVRAEEAPEVDIEKEIVDYLDCEYEATKDGFEIEITSELKGKAIAIVFTADEIKEFSTVVATDVDYIKRMILNIFSDCIGDVMDSAEPIEVVGPTGTTDIELGTYYEMTGTTFEAPLNTSIIFFYDAYYRTETYGDESDTYAYPYALGGFYEFQRVEGATGKNQFNSSLLIPHVDGAHMQYGTEKPYGEDADKGFADFVYAKGKIGKRWSRIFYEDNAIYAFVYNTEAEDIDAEVTSSVELGFIADEYAVKIEYTFTNPTEAAKKLVFATAADTAVEDNDGSKNSVNEDKSILTMTDEKTNQTLFLLSNDDGYTIIPTEYSSAGIDLGDVIRGADPRLTDIDLDADDSAFVGYFPEITLEAGASITYTIIVGSANLDDVQAILNKIIDSKGDAPEIKPEKQPAQFITEAVAKTGLVFNGEEQEIANDATTNHGTILFAVDYDEESPEKTLWFYSAPPVIDAGEHVLYYYILGDETHLDSEVKTLTVNIAPAEVDIVADNKAKMFGADEVELTYSGTFGLVEGLVISRAPGEELGEYEITIDTTGVTDTNYIIKSVKSGKYSIEGTKREYDMSGVKFLDKTVKVTDEDKKIEITGELPVGLDNSVLTVTYVNNENDKPGVYTVTAKFSTNSSLYNAPADMTAVLTIRWVHDETKDEADNKPLVKIDSENGIDPTLTLVVTVADSKDIKQVKSSIKSNLKSNDKIFASYDVSLVDTNNVKHQPDGTIKVYITIPEALKDSTSFKVFHIHGDSSVEAVSYTIDGSYVVVTTNKLSSFAFVDKVKSSSCAWHFVLIPLLVAFVAFAAVYAFVLKKNLDLVSIIVSAAFGVLTLVFGILGMIAGCAICIAFTIINILVGITCVALFVVMKKKSE